MHACKDINNSSAFRGWIANFHVALTRQPVYILIHDTIIYTSFIYNGKLQPFSLPYLHSVTNTTAFFLFRYPSRALCRRTAPASSLFPHRTIPIYSHIALPRCSSASHLLAHPPTHMSMAPGLLPTTITYRSRRTWRPPQPCIASGHRSYPQPTLMHNIITYQPTCHR